MALANENQKKGPLEYVVPLYMAIGVLFALVKLFSGRIWLFMYDTRPWYQRIWSDVVVLRREAV
jgi:hypothetical protein